tara:strand:+ start:308 stop:673 length:366 start_codon:yes stop_codon:yes gene_type:complete
LSQRHLNIVFVRDGQVHVHRVGRTPPIEGGRRHTQLSFQIVQQYAKRIPVATDTIWLQLACSGVAQIKLETIAVETTAVPVIALATVRAIRRQPVYDSSVTHIAFVLLFLFVVWSKKKNQE